MNKIMIGLAIFANMTFLPVAADPEVKGWKTLDSMGCMMVEECTDEVRQVKSWRDLGPEYGEFSQELDSIFASMDKLDIKFFLAGDKYFVGKTRGLYSVDSNNFFVNERYLSNTARMLQVIRHEGWHAVQDCMAGTLDNTFTAIVYPTSTIPDWIKDGANRTYMKSVAIYEAEAMAAMYSDTTTKDGLAVCASDTPMWKRYPPTPLTEKWLIKKGFMTK
tara:strand:- start:549 stop:1205 length:657 start_codon:yes stop_codon:yes gene_type:complete